MKGETNYKDLLPGIRHFLTAAGFLAAFASRFNRTLFVAAWITCCSLSIKCVAQNDTTVSLALLKTVSGSFSGFTADNLGNIYAVNSSNQIKKINEKGDSVAVYNDVKRYGNIYSIDATNPLKILVYYKDFATVVVLDRLLNVRNTIDLRKQQVFKVQAITSSYDGNIWLYDELAGKIRKIDDYGKSLVETTDFRLIFDEVPQPTHIYDRDGQLYLYDSSIGMLVFDYYGAQKNTLAIKGLTDVQVLDKNTITGRDSSRLMIYKPLTLDLRFYRIADLANRFRSIRFTANRLYTLTPGGGIEIYQMP